MKTINEVLAQMLKLVVIQLAPNQTIIKAVLDNKYYYVFISYQTIIAVDFISDGVLFINSQYWDYSKTTMKYLAKFVNDYTRYTYENKAQFRELIYSIKEDGVMPF